MNCKIEFSKNGKINKVLDQSGRPSKLFEQIFNTPILSLNQAIDTYKNIYSEKLQNKIINTNGEINRLYPQEERGLNQAGRIAEDATNILRRGKKTSRDAQEVELENYAKENNIWIEGYENSFGEFIKQGMESRVYFDENSQKITKINDLEFYTPSEFFEMVAIHNYLFPQSKYVVKGFTKRQDTDRFSVIVEQDFIKADSIVIEEQVDFYMNSAGFVKQDNGVYTSEDYIISDLHQENVFISDGELMFIDPVIRLNTPDDIYNGSRGVPNLVEPPLTFQTPKGEVFNTYQEAIQNTPQGNIELKVEEVTIGEANSDTDNRTFEGTINDLVKSGLLTGERVLEVNGDEVFITAGNSFNKKLINATIIEEEASKVFKVKRLKDNNFIFENTVGIRKVGEKTVKIEELNAMTPQQLIKEFGEDNAMALLSERVYKESVPAFGDKKVVEEAQEFTPENELQIALLNLLNKMGVKTTSISDYITKFAQKNGVDPSAQALADIAERIVAFKDNLITTEQLSEEVAHFIVETLPQEQIENILRNIHRTEAYAQYAEMYREIYAKEYSAEELENVVRREILGKILGQSFQSNFAQKQGATQTENTIIERLREFFTNFFNAIQAYFKPQYQTELQTLQDKIYTNLMTNELIGELNLEQMEGNKLRLYSANNTANTELDKLYQRATKALELLQSQDRRISKSTSATRQQLEDAKNNLNRDLSKAEKIASLSSIVRVAKKHVNYLKTAAQKNKGKKYIFSQEENAVYITTLGSLLGYLNEMNTLLNPKAKDEALIKQELEAVVLEINALEGYKKTAQGDAWSQIVDEVAVKLSLTAPQKEKLLNGLNNIEKDTNWFFAHISSMTHAQNPALNAMNHVTSKMYANSNIRSNNRIKSFLKKLEDIGFDPKQLKKFKDGSYLLSPIDFERVEADLLDKKIEIYKSLKGDITKEQFLELEENKELFDANEVEMSLDFYDTINEWQAENQWENALKESIRNERKSFINNLNLSKETLRFDRMMSRERSAVSREAEALGEYTQEHKYRLEEINSRRQLAKSPFGVNGEFKQGLMLNEQGEVVADPSEPNPSKDAKLALELARLDTARFEQFAKKFGDGSRGIPTRFREKLSQAQDPLDFLFLNANISFSNEFWNKLGDKDSIVEKLENADDQDKAQELITKIKKVQLKRSFILRSNKVYNQPSEINYADMSGNDIESVKELTEQLQVFYSEAKSLLPKEDVEVVEDVFSSEANQAFLNELQDRNLTNENLEEIISFIKEHVTAQDRIKIERAKVVADELIKGYRKEIPKGFESIFSGVTDKQAVYLELEKYAETKLLPYFKRFEPSQLGNTGKSFTDILSELKTGKKSAEEFLNEIENGKYPEINFTPNFIFFSEAENEDLNPKYKANQEAGLPQIRTDRYGNKKYEEYFGVKNGLPTKNEKDYQALQALMEYHEQSLEATGMKNSHNKFLLPQKGMRGVRQWGQLVKKTNLSTVKEILKDATQYREDEAEYGQGFNGRALGGKQGELTIPKYGFSKLKDQSDVTDELLLSYAWMGQEAELYNARVEAFADMESIRELILNSSIAGKDVEASNTYKMFDSFYRYNLYGQNETFSYETDFGGLLSKKQNLAPLAKKFQTWIRLVNLGWSLIVPFTSLLQGGVNYIIEKSVGERINADASKLARKKLSGIIGEAVSDSLGLNAKAKMNVLGEYFGTFSALERFENSNYSKGARGLIKSSYLTHTLGDAPIKGQVLLTVLHDFRVVGGDILNYNQYKSRRKIEDKSLTEKQLRADWKLTEDNAIYNFLDIANGAVTPNKVKLEQQLGKTGAELDSFVDLKLQSVRDSLALAVQDLDSMISPQDRSLAQRNAIFSFLFLHKSWLTVAYNRKLKGRHLNLYSGLEEEGNYTGTANFFASLIKEYKNPANSKNFITHLKKQWGEADETTRRSLHRTAMEVAATNILVALSIVLANVADDDEDKDWLTEFSAYMTYRTTNEVLSTTTALPNQVAEFLDSPVVGLNQLYQLLHVADLGEGDLVTQGRFRGETERMRWIYKSLPLAKEYYNVTRIDRTRDVYEFYNSDNMKWALMTHLLAEKE